MNILKNLELKLGNLLAIGLCTANVIRNYVELEFQHNHTLMFISVVAVYVSVLLTWFIIFYFSQPTYKPESFYKYESIGKGYFWAFLANIPIVSLVYCAEINFAHSLEGIDVQKFLLLYALRFVFTLALTVTFKYLLDTRDTEKYFLEEVHKLKEANTKAQFELLKQQINPHFLFNALSTLKSLIRLQDPNAEDFVMSLSDVYRKLLQRRDKELIRLSDEIEIVNSYLFMQKLRFEGNLSIEIDIKEAYLETTYLPPFALQILLENSIKHNIISQRKPLTIYINTTDNQRIVIKNTLQPKKNNEESTSWGLSNLIERFNAFSKEKVEIEKTETSFSVSIPLLMV